MHVAPHMYLVYTPANIFDPTFFSPQECVCSHVIVSKSQDEGTGRCLYILTQTQKRLKRTREVAGTDFALALFLAYRIFVRGGTAV
jgi:hypothetical protein